MARRRIMQPALAPVDTPVQAPAPFADPSSPSFSSSMSPVEEARNTILKIMRSGGRNSLAKLQAAKFVISNDFMATLSDEQLLEEVNRRVLAQAAKKKTP